MPPVASRLYDPAKDAARLLGWFGLAVLMVGAPVVSIVSRRALFIVLPVGAAILGAAYALALSNAGLKALRGALATPIGLAGSFLAGWAGLSIAWTAFPEAAAPRYVATLATALVAAVVIAHLPERRVSRHLYLLPAGLAATAIATAGLALFGPASFRGGTEFDPSLIERSAITLTILVWPALGALGAFGRWRWAIGLAILVAGASLAAGAQIVLAVFAFAATAFAFATSAPQRTGMIVAIAFAALVIAAPALPFVLAPLADALPAVGRSTVAALADWREFLTLDPIRMTTGHGLDSVAHGILFGDLPPHTPRSILFEIWYDLGLLGAAAFAIVFGFGLVAAGRAAPTIAPALVGGLVATLTIAIFGVASSELWYVALLSVQAVALGLLARASRSGRPSVETLHE